MNYYVIEQALQLNLSTGIKVGKDLRGHLILYSLHHHRSNVYLTPLTGNSLLFKKAHFIFRKLLLNLDMSSVPIFFFTDLENSLNPSSVLGPLNILRQLPRIPVGFWP